MTLRVAINGFGRIGRNFMRCWLSRGAYTNIEVVGINVTSDPKTNAHLLKYDSVLGQLEGVDIKYTDDTFVINNKTIKCFSDRNPMNLPWKDWGVDSITKSIPQSFQGKFIGFLSEKHLIVLLFITKVSSVF